MTDSRTPEQRQRIMQSVGQQNTKLSWWYGRSPMPSMTGMATLPPRLGFRTRSIEGRVMRRDGAVVLSTGKVAFTIRTLVTALDRHPSQLATSSRIPGHGQRLQTQLMDIPYKAPAFQATHFNCPHSSCRAYAQQVWWQTHGIRPGHLLQLQRLKVSRCVHCNQEAYWLDEKLVDPASRGAPLANPDLSDEIKRDYDEAANIEQQSPKGAAALLRLCLQRLCRDLGQKGENINTDIKALVLDGLPVEIQQALDVVRVVGNNAVHPGTIDLDDNPETVSTLFLLINAIADRMITQRKKVAELYGALPPGVLEQIKKRDAAKP